MINPFLDACGATGPLLLGTESPGAPGVETRAFDLPFVLLGRDPRSDLRLAHADVSDRHGYFQLVDGQLLCVDLGSRIGIYQGGKCQRLAYVERDQAVRVGPYRVRLLGGDSGRAPRPQQPDYAPLSLTVEDHAARESRRDLPGGLSLVGSASDCQVRVSDPGVSNYHCSLVHTAEGVWVVDLLGQGGVRVNGQEVGYARLHEGDALEIGRSVLRIAPKADDEAPAAGEVEAPAAVTAPAALTPRAAAVAVPAEFETSSDLVGRVVGPIVSQVGEMQRQIVDEFQQARAMLFDTFTALQQEQTAFIRQELEQIRQLSQDLQALRADLENQTRLFAEQMLSAPAPRLGSATSTAPRPGVPGVNGNGNGNGHRLDLLAAVPQRPFLNGVPEPSPGPFTRPTAPQHAPSHPHHDRAHALLCARIVRLTTRQKTLWEKLVTLIPGATGRRGTTT